MNDELLLEIFHGQGDLFEIISSLNFADFLSSFDQFIHGLIGAELEEDIDVVGIFEVFLVFDYEF